MDATVAVGPAMELRVEIKRTLTKAIKSKARELGFAKVGIARAEALVDEGQRFRQWLSQGYHATMAWMERTAEKRVDPRTILPNALSVISVAMNYYTEAQHSSEPGTGKISRYAWGDDYHDVLESRIESLVECIKSLAPRAEVRIYVDTGPMMDKAWAVRAGLGWLGKHTNVILKEYGSWAFLGEILTDLELEYDEPIEDFCGTCRACIDACPTAAIVDQYLLDSNKCISYLTIEHKGEIPREFIPRLENWIYGCDICQDVCPWNRFQQPSREAAFLPREQNIAPKLDKLAEISSDEFSRLFRRSPVKRTKREGLVRNVKAVLASHKK